MINNLTPKQKAMFAIEEYNRKLEEDKIALLKEQKAKQEEQAFREGLFDTAHNAVDVNRRFSKWCAGVKESLVASAIEKVYTESFNPLDTYSKDYTAVRNYLVNSFVKTEGADTLIARFRLASTMLSEYALIIENTYKTIVEKADKNDEATYTIDTEVKDEFFDKLNMATPEGVINTIRTRISDAVEEFINKNAQDKIEIKDILQDVQDRVDNAKNEEVKESYTLQGKRKISAIYNRPKNLFGSMAYNLSEAAMTNDTLKKEYMVENKLDLDSVMEVCKNMYTFLETVSTIRAKVFTEAEIEDVLKNIKE